MLIPGVFQDMLSIDAGDTAKLQIANQNDMTWRVIVRGIVNQLPGQQFTNFQTTAQIYDALGGIPVVVPMTDYKAILDEEWTNFPDRAEAFQNKTAAY